MTKGEKKMSYTRMAPGFKQPGKRCRVRENPGKRASLQRRATFKSTDELLQQVCSLWRCAPHIP